MEEVDIVLAAKLAGKEEDWRAEAYYDSKRIPTIGFGFRLGPVDTPLAAYSYFKLPREAGYVMLQCMLRDYTQVARASFTAAWNAMNNDRRIILLSMIHQMGANGVSKFQQFLRAAAASNWREASNQMLDSNWAKTDSPARARRHADVMFTGSITKVYGEL